MRLARGGDGENLGRGRTIDTLMMAPSIWDSCIWAIAASASASVVYRIYAVPRFVLTVKLASKTGAELAALHVLFTGMSRSRIGPNVPKISRRWFSLTFFVSFSMTT